MRSAFEQNIIEQGLFSKNDRLIIAASGGLDSCVLIELCRQSGYAFSLAHCNFRLRGQESDRDETFVRELAGQLGLELKLRHFDTEKFASEHKLSIQEAARELRYEWFSELCSEPGTFLLTAHHRDDAIETLLMNFFRGTGLRGMTGIPAANGKIRRPLLIFYREELERFAALHQLRWVEDSSNLSSAYTRNYFRNELIPSIEKIFPQARKNLGEHLERFSEIAALYDTAVSRIREKLVRQNGAEFLVPVKQLLQFRNRALVYEIIRAFGFGEKQVGEVLRLASGETGRFLLSPDNRYRLIRHRHWLVFSPATDTASAHIVIETSGERLRYDGEILDVVEMDIKEVEMRDSPQWAFVNAQLLKFPLLLRKRKTGDYFYPLGMRKKKKLSRFLIDQKLSVSRKENVWVIENGDGKIVWVVGLRIDDRFRLTASTRRCVRFRVTRD